MWIGGVVIIITITIVIIVIIMLSSMVIMKWKPNTCALSKYLA